MGLCAALDILQIQCVEQLSRTFRRAKYDEATLRPVRMHSGDEDKLCAGEADARTDLADDKPELV